MAVVLFPNSQTAVQAERVFQREGIHCKLIPVPRHISNTCGLALRFPLAERESACGALDRAGIYHSGVYEL